MILFFNRVFTYLGAFCFPLLSRYYAFATPKTVIHFLSRVATVLADVRLDEAVFNRIIYVKTLRSMFSFFRASYDFVSFILECIIDKLLYTDRHFIIAVKLDD